MEQLVAILEVDTPDLQGRVYPSALIQTAIDEFEVRINSNEVIIGECGIPDPSTEDMARFFSIDMGRASHIIKHIWLDGKILKAKISLVGKYAELAKLGWSPEVAPRAVGDFNDSGECIKYSLITLDLAYNEIVEEK